MTQLAGLCMGWIAGARGKPGHRAMTMGGDFAWQIAAADFAGVAE
ncbi:hypothetical protein [Devosia faecipullorum]|nr:hypothetical protein [Devosia faecipullorum]